MSISRPHSALLIAGIASLLTTGCAYKQTRVSQEGMRETLLDLYTDQVMDNLIRTQQNLPILQVAYSNAVGQVTNTTTVQINEGEQWNHNVDGFTPGKSFEDFFNIGGSQGITDQISVVADPMVKPSIAKAYGSYADKVKLEVSTAKPKPGVYHVLRKFGNAFYYIDEKDKDSQVAFVELYNEVSQSEAPRPSKAFDQLLDEQNRTQLNELTK